MKHIKNTILLIIMSFMFTMGVSAASGSITVSSNTRTAVVGSTFTVTIKVSCSETIGSWQFGVAYDSGNVSLISGDTSVAGFGDGSIKSKTYTYKFKAIKSGSAKIRIVSPSMVSWNDDANLFVPSAGSTTVTVKTQAEIEASYSKDNNLKSLSVQGYEISPAFDKNVTNYTVSVPDTLTEIVVSASKNDSNASVSGAGTIDISEGTNKVEIVVTAQNGAIKTYTIMVDVKDLNPINVKVNDKDYTVVKKSDLLIAPTGYTLKTIKIGEIEVPAYTSTLTKMTVLGLKDSAGAIGMFIYDEDKNTYTKYNELKAHALTLYPVALEDIPDGFAKTKLKINELEYECLKSDKIKEFYLIYAMNVETGNTSYYIYDKKENSFVTYNREIFEKFASENEELKLYLFALIGVSGILLLLTIILGSKNSKLKKLIRKISKSYEPEQKEEPAETIIEKSKESSEDIVDTVKDDTESVEIEEDFLEERKRRKKKHKHR